MSPLDIPLQNRDALLFIAESQSSHRDSDKLLGLELDVITAAPNPAKKEFRLIFQGDTDPLRIGLPGSSQITRQPPQEVWGHVRPHQNGHDTFIGDHFVETSFTLASIHEATGYILRLFDLSVLRPEILLVRWTDLQNVLPELRDCHFSRHWAHNLGMPMPRLNLDFEALCQKTSQADLSFRILAEGDHFWTEDPTFKWGEE